MKFLIPTYISASIQEPKTFINTQSSGQETFIGVICGKCTSLTTGLRSPSASKEMWGLRLLCINAVYILNSVCH